METADSHSSAEKKAKLEITSVDMESLARLVQFIGNRWGHLYREPNDVDYAWRWELFHGQTGKSHWDTTAKNPRRGLSLENTRFLLDETVYASLRFAGEPTTPQQMEAVSLLAFLTDPSRTGVVDELLALYQSGVVRIDCHGVPRLSSTWHKNVDVLLLEEMMSSWNVDTDPLGKYGVHETLRSLSTKWIRHDEGWALTSAPDDIIYEPEEFAVWRGAFETKHEQKTDDMHGVGRFGI